MNTLSSTSYPGEHALKNFISYLSTFSCSRTSPLKPHMLMNNNSKSSYVIFHVSVLIYHLTSYLDEHLPLKFIAYFTEFSCYLSLFIAYLSISYLDELICYLALFSSWQCQPLWRLIIVYSHLYHYFNKHKLVHPLVTTGSIYLVELTLSDPGRDLFFPP